MIPCPRVPWSAPCGGVSAGPVSDSTAKFQKGDAPRPVSPLSAAKMRLLSDREAEAPRALPERVRQLPSARPPPLSSGPSYGVRPTPKRRKEGHISLPRRPRSPGCEEGDPTQEREAPTERGENPRQVTFFVVLATRQKRRLFRVRAETFRND